MKTSDQIDLITAALATAQGEFPVIEKKRENPFFKSKYADLSDILVACIPVLSKHGLALCQGIAMRDARVTITTRLAHKSGQWLEDELSMKPEKDSPQAIGSAATYGRRYGAEGMLGVSATQDDDGNEATGKKDEPKKKEAPAPVHYTGAPQQKAWLMNLLTNKGIDQADMASYHERFLGKTLEEIIRNLGVTK